jgi:CP family cyanate transporter-like MFS transporter
MMVIGVDLRASMGALPALMIDIERELGLSAFTQGMATSMAIAFMCLSAPLGPLLGRLLGHDRTLSALLALLTGAMAMRLVIAGPGTLLASVALAGVAMGVGAGVIPALISRHVIRHQGTAAGIYSTGMSMGVALTAGTALPLAHWLGGWRPALAFPALATAGTLVTWELLRRRRVSAGVSAIAVAPPPVATPWRTSTGWLVSLYVATPMLVGFTALAWVVPFLVQEGWSPARAAALFVAFQFSQFVTMLALAPFFDRQADKRLLLGIPLLLAAAGLGGLMTTWLAPPELTVPLMGLGVGGATALGMALIPAVSKTPVESGRLGSMVFTVAFALSATGPAALGALKDATDSFHFGFACLAGCSLAALAVVAGLGPGRTALEPVIEIADPAGA